MKRYVLGLDGGGTKTQALIADEECHVIGCGIGGPSNYDDVGTENARAGIAETVRLARQHAALPEKPFDSIFLGIAGVMSEEDRAVIHTIARQLNLAVSHHTCAPGHFLVTYTNCRLAPNTASIHRVVI